MAGLSAAHFESQEDTQMKTQPESSLQSDSSLMEEGQFNQRVVLNSRPIGKPIVDNFRIEELPLSVPDDGEMLLKTLFLSLDPYMRGRMSNAASYAAPISVGQTIVGGTVSRVISSRHPGFRDGDLVVGMSGWQRFEVSDGKGLIKLDPSMPQPSLALGVLGMPGFTAYMGLLDIGDPQMGETVVVAAASGAVGSVVGQIARLKGCRAIGIAGGPEKCAYVVNELGFDACIDHRASDFTEKLKAACHEGIDVYFESVGGAVFDVVLPLLNTKARVPVCGLISSYNDTELPQGPDRLSLLMRTILTKRLTFKGFIIFDDYGARFEEFQARMSEWVRDGKVKFREDIVDGLSNAPSAFIGLLEGRNFGKLIVQVADE